MSQPRTLALCVGMHRSGTSLTASLLQGIGLPLPGDLIAADASNPSGYFENRAVVDAQETLLQELGMWWPTEAASRGLPRSAESTALYQAHVEWLTQYLQRLFEHQGPRLAIKDPRTSLLLPAWREAAARLGVQLQLVICVRQPRDVCWSLVWRDGPSVGMSWRRAQRLWLEHYRAVLLQGRDLPARVAVYEAWLEPGLAAAQLQHLADFLGIQPTASQLQAALERVKPEFNHGGGERLPPVQRSLRRLHACLVTPTTTPAHWRGMVRRATRGLARQEQVTKALMRARLLWLRTPWGEAQLGLGRLGPYRRAFRSQHDPRLHPLLSPAHLNAERQRLGLPPLRSADALFAHLLDPDLIPLDPHPWFQCRAYQLRSHSVGAAGVHPLLTYLRRASQRQPNPWPEPQWLEQLGAARPTHELEPLPSLVQRLHPGLVARLGDPASGDQPVIRAHEAYWQDIADTFALWPADDSLGPLRWLDRQIGLDELGTSQPRPARGLELWWLPGDWHAALLADLAGADPQHFCSFPSLEALIEALEARQSEDPPVLLSLTPALLAHLLARQTALPAGVAVLNLVWPAPGEQTAWLQLLAGATLVIDCRATVRAYLQGIGLRALWCPAPPDAARGDGHQRQLLLAFGDGPAEAQLTPQAGELDPHRYSTVLRLDAQLQSMGDDPQAVSAYLERMRRNHGRWLWLEEPPGPEDIRGQAVLAWAQQRQVPLSLGMTNGTDHPTDATRPKPLLR